MIGIRIFLFVETIITLCTFKAYRLNYHGWFPHTEYNLVRTLGGGGYTFRVIYGKIKGSAMGNKVNLTELRLKIPPVNFFLYKNIDFL